MGEKVKELAKLLEKWEEIAGKMQEQEIKIKGKSYIPLAIFHEFLSAFDEFLTTRDKKREDPTRYIG